MNENLTEGSVLTRENQQQSSTMLSLRKMAHMMNLFTVLKFWIALCVIT